MFCQQLIFDESSVEYGGNMPHLDTLRILDGRVRKVIGCTLYNQRLLNILNKISFHIFDSHIKKDPKGKSESSKTSKNTFERLDLQIKT